MKKDIKNLEHMLTRQLRYEKALSECSRILLRMPDNEEAIKSTMQILLDVSQTSRIYIFKNVEDAKHSLCMRQLYEVCAPGIESQIENEELQCVIYEAGFVRWQENLSKDLPIKGLIDEFPIEEQELLRSQGIISLLVLPIWVKGKWYGFIGFDDTEIQRKWSEDDVRFLRIASEMIGIYIERKNFEKEGDENRRRYVTLAQNLKDVIWTTDLNLNYTYITPSIAYTGFLPEEFIGKNVSEFLSENSIKIVKGMFEKYMGNILENRDEEVLVELDLRRKDGSIYRGEVSVSFMFDEAGELIGIVGVTRDITKRYQAEQEKIFVEKKFEALFNHASECILLMELVEGVPIIVDANIAACRMHGYERDEMLGESIFLIDAPKYKKDVNIWIKRMLNGESVTFEIEHVRKDGSLFPVEVSAQMVNIGDKQYILGIDRDITEQKKTTAKIKASLIEKEMLLREVHHRVKNNMQVISSILSLQSRYIDDAKMKNIFEESRNRINTMALIHEKLYGSKDFSNIAYEDYVRELISDLLALYGQQSGKIEINISMKDIHFGFNQAIPCGLVINELVSNALKYAFVNKKNGIIDIVMRKQGINYELIVRDNGSGLPEDIDFRHTKSLGLLLVVALVENQLMGKIDLRRNKGTEFKVKFKVKENE
jgi:PAS domain S-box-containing protein